VNRAKKDSVQENLEKRMKKNKKTVGKLDMFRSTKPDQKKEVMKV
jgi:hypothetical protein